MKPEMEEILYLDAVEIAQMVRQKDISCYELMQVCLARIERINPRLNALVNLASPEKALEMAKQADKALSRGDTTGPFHGLPHAVKDLTDLKGWPTTAGWMEGVQNPELSKLGFGTPKISDSLLVHRMRRAGLLFIGKTNVPEFGLGSHTVNRLFGSTRNPYALDKTAGGSSGGAASALASGMLPLADGSDLGGSLRNPAAFCNVVGFRPSIGRVPAISKGFDVRLATDGPLARSVRDVAALFSVQAGPDPGDPLAHPEWLHITEEKLKTRLQNLRIGWTPDFGHLPVEKEIIEACRESLSIFDDLGVKVEENAYPNIMEADHGAGEIDAMRVFRTYRVLALSDFIGELTNAIGPEGIRKYTNRPTSVYQFTEAFDGVNIHDFYLAKINRSRIYDLFMSFFRTFDFLITPTTQVKPFDLSVDYVSQVNDRNFGDYLEWMAICCIVSLTGLPAISIPCGFTPGGLPVGLQIIGKPKADLPVLQLAYAFEQATRFSAKYRDRRPKL